MGGVLPAERDSHGSGFVHFDEELFDGAVELMELLLVDIMLTIRYDDQPTYNIQAYPDQL